MASGRRRSSTISPTMVSLPDNARVDILRFAVTNSFKQRFTEEGHLHINRWDVDFPCLDSLSSSSLEAPFTENEIYYALKKVDGEKAPGSYGFSFKFVKSF